MNTLLHKKIGKSYCNGRTLTPNNSEKKLITIVGLKTKKKYTCLTQVTPSPLKYSATNAAVIT